MIIFEIHPRKSPFTYVGGHLFTPHEKHSTPRIVPNFKAAGENNLNSVQLSHIMRFSNKEKSRSSQVTVRIQYTKNPTLLRLTHDYKAHICLMENGRRHISQWKSRVRRSSSSFVSRTDNNVFKSSIQRASSSHRTS